MKHTLTLLTALLLAPLAAVLVIAETIPLARAAEFPSLVPDRPGTTPNYWCTWAVQNYMHGQGLKECDPALFEGLGGAALARGSLNEQCLLGTNGWTAKFYPACRADLYLVLDDGWDVPAENTAPWYSSLILDGGKFPGFAALTPAQRLKKLNDVAKAAGWRGIGLWLAAQESAAARAGASDDQYWTDRVRWCKEAGIEYWKVDWGKKSTTAGFRRFQTELARKEYPALIVEHMVRHDPFNEFPQLDAGWVEKVRQQATFAQIVRLYDLSPQLSLPAMLDRVASVLAAAQAEPTAGALFNCDDEPYIAAGLGVCMGVLRHPLTGLRPGTDPDLFFSGPRQQKRRMDEVTRAVRWQRLAPAFAGGPGAVVLDAERLTDSWQYKRGDFWTAASKLIQQAAPARVARGLPLPVVTGAGEKPYLIASRHPNGAIAVASLGRMSHDKGWSEPEVEVTLQVGSVPPAVAVFGRFKSVTLLFAQPLAADVRVVAQDLVGDRPVDITARCLIKDTQLTLPGELIATIGLSAATPGDLSSPGLVLTLRK